MRWKRFHVSCLLTKFSPKSVLVSITLCNASINTWLKMDLNAKSVTFLMVISLQNFKTMHILLVMTCFQRKKKKHFVVFHPGPNRPKCIIWGLDDRPGEFSFHADFKKCMKDFRWDSAGVIMRQEWSRSVSPICSSLSHWKRTDREKSCYRGLMFAQRCQLTPTITHQPALPLSSPLSLRSHVPLFSVSHLLLFLSLIFLYKCRFFCAPCV